MLAFRPAIGTGGLPKLLFGPSPPRDQATDGCDGSSPVDEMGAGVVRRVRGLRGAALLRDVVPR